MTAARCPVCTLTHDPHCASTRDLRWPIEPLTAITGSCNGIVRLCGAAGGTVSHAALYGLTDRQADLWATRLGRHPDTIWPGWCAAALTPLDEMAVTGWRPAWQHDHTT